jgi:virulence-associated protein VapD
MEFNYVIKESVEVSDVDFEEMIKYLREYPDADYEDAIVEVLSNTYYENDIEQVKYDVAEELKKRDLIDEEQGNIYLRSDDCDTVKDFFELIDHLLKKSKGKRTDSDIIHKLFEIYNANKDEFDNRYEVMKIKF